LVAGQVGVELNSLRSEAQAFRGAAFATATKRTYRSQANSYFKFCQDFGLVPLPASQETLLVYMAFLARSLSANSVPGYMNVVRLLHLEAGFSNPLVDNWELKAVQKGVSRLLGKPPRQKSPITVSILLDLFKTVKNTPFDTAFWITCLVSFYGFLRKSTVLPSNDLLRAGKFIARSDLIDLSLTSFSIVIKQSKTIQFGQRQLVLPYVSSSDYRLCPVKAMLKHLGLSKLSCSSPLFNYVEAGTECVFNHVLFVKRLKKGLLLTGHNATELSCHSFRRGGATLGFALGLSAIDIKLRGDWRSNAYEKYLMVSMDANVSSVSTLTEGAAAFARS
jgi:hypothetical protein